MSLLALLLVVAQALSNAAALHTLDGRFSSRLFDAGGSAVSGQLQLPREVWLELRSTGGSGNDTGWRSPGVSGSSLSSRHYWLLLVRKERHYLPILVKSANDSLSSTNTTHTQSPDCLYSAASPLIPQPSRLGAHSHHRTHKRLIGRLIRALSPLTSSFAATQFLTVSLCDGISGIVPLHNSSSYVYLNSIPQSNIVHLQESSSAFAHEKLVNLNPLEQSLARLAERTATGRKRRKRASFEMPVAQNMSGPWLVELYIIVDASIERLNAYNRYHTLVNRVMNVINHVNMAFSQFNIYFTVIQLEIWKHDQITLTDENHILNELQLYKRRFITKRHDCLHAILGGDLGSSRRGEAEPASMCGYNSCVGYTKNYSDPNDVELSHSVLHELGHNFGLHHDTEQCHCFDCIMSTGVQFRSTMFRWSNCSKKEIVSLLKSGMAECLRDRPAVNLAELRPVIMEPHNMVSAIGARSTATCGNGVVDEGEQCDCGDNSLCKCCDWKTCRFKRGARCAGGSCCDLSTCLFKKSGETCRPVGQDSCDLPEFCNGVTEWCPADLAKQDGTVCSTNAYRDSSLCYRGRCESRYSRCQLLWGETATEASHYCYEMNKDGDSVKNCGLEIPRQVDRDRQPRNWNRIKCAQQDTVCGRLWCSHDNERVLSSSAHTAVDETVNGHHCSAVTFDMDWFFDELGMVPNGATCGSGKVCWKSSCVRISSIKFGDCFCHGHGVCNNLGHCHCDPGFAPPNCTSPGDGGSIDSGPPVTFHSRFRMVTAAIIISLIVILTALVVVAFIYHYRNHTWPLLLSTIKCPRYGKPLPRYHTSALDTTTSNNQYSKFRKPVVLTIDVKHDLDQNLHRSPLYSPKSPEKLIGQSRPSPKSPAKSPTKPWSVREKAKFLENSGNSSSQKPLAEKHNAKPAEKHNAKPAVNVSTNLNPTTTKNPPKITHQKPTASATVTEKQPPILCEKPPKLPKTQPVNAVQPPPVASEKPAKAVAEPQHPPKPFSSKAPVEVNQKPVKALAEVREVRHPPKPLSTKTPVNHAAPPGKPETRGNQKQSDLEAKAASSKVLRDILEKGKRPPISTTDKPVKPPSSTVSVGSSVSNSTIKSDKPLLAKPATKPSQSFAQREISKPKLEHTTNNQSVVNAGGPPPVAETSRPTSAHVLKRPPLLMEKPALKAAPTKTVAAAVDNDKSSVKPLGGAKDPKDATKKPPSKYQISQPRLEQTTCTDATQDLPATDKTLTRNIAPHRILKCDPDKAVKYL